MKKNKSLAFSENENSFAVILKNGIYKQVPTYNSEGYLYAKWGGGFIRLMDKHKTSIHNASWRSIEGVDYKITGLYGYLEVK